jgi:AcrR family transcriptional regulator
MEEKSTREKLLEAAEVLFVKKGYEGVSVRDLTEAAGVNVAAINYHFKGKKDLYREVFRRMLAPVAQRRLEELASVIPKAGAPDLREVIRTYVSGFLGEMLASREAECCLNRVSVEMSRSGIATDVLVKEMVMPVHRVIKEAIRRARPDLTEEKISLCIISIAGQIIHFVRAKEVIRRLAGRGYSKEFMNEIIEHITDFSLRGMGQEVKGT